MSNLSMNIKSLSSDSAQKKESNYVQKSAFFEAYKGLKGSRSSILMLIFVLTISLVSCSDDEKTTTPTVQEFTACLDQNFVITEPNPNLPWTPNAITLISEKVANNVFAIYDSRATNADPNNFPALATSAGFVIGENAVFLVESMANRQLLCQVYDHIRSETDLPILYVGNTNDHFDHSFGNAYLPDDVQVVQHERTADRILDHFDEEMAFALNVWGQDQGIQEATYRAADVRVGDNGWSVDLGGVTVEAKYFGFGQTEGDLFFYVPEKGVMWTGNSLIAEAPAIPWLLDGGAVESAVTMTAVRDFLPENAVIIPGHGRPVDRNGFNFTIDYLNTLISEVQASIDAGNDLETTQATVLMPDFQGYSLWGFAHSTLNVPNTFNDLK